MTRNELGRFLSARRAALSPDDAGIQWSGVRRVPGLRREEVAMATGVSVDYYARLEQGRELHPSASVLDALCRALHLGDDAREHLFRLAGGMPTAAPTANNEQVDRSLLALMDAWPDTPTLVINRRLDVLARNTLATALYSSFDRVENLARMIFLDESAPTFLDDWQRAAEASVANLRLALGFDPHDAATLALVNELDTGSRRFAALWKRNDARGKVQEAKTFVHPEVGRLTLEYNAFDVRTAPGQQLIVYRAEPGSTSDNGLRLLGALAATRRVSEEIEQRG